MGTTYYHDRKKKTEYKPMFQYGKPETKYPIMVAQRPGPMREVALSLDPDYFVYLSDGMKYINAVKRYYELQTPVIEENKRKLARARKNRNSRQIAMRLSLKQREEETRMSLMDSFFSEIADRILNQYDILIIPDPYILNMIDLYSYRGGNEYYGHAAMKKSHYDYFYRTLFGMAAAKMLNNMILIAPTDIVVGCFNTCSICGTPRGDIYGPESSVRSRQWKCECCGTHHQPSLNEAINLFKYKDYLLKKRMVYRY